MLSNMRSKVYIVTLPEYGHIIPLVNFYRQKFVDMVCILVPKGFSYRVKEIISHAFPNENIAIQELEGEYIAPESYSHYTVFTHFYSTLSFLLSVKSYLMELSKKENHIQIIVDAVIEYFLDKKFLKKISKVTIVHPGLPIFLRTCLRYHVKITSIFGNVSKIPKSIYKLTRLFYISNRSREYKIYLRNFHKNFKLPRYIYGNEKITSSIAMPSRIVRISENQERKELVSEELTNFIKRYKRIIYISFGTVFEKDVKVFEYVLACIPTDIGIVISCKKGQETILKEKLPKKLNLHIGIALPQMSILRKSCLIVTHGGYNTINEALYFDVPMLLLPHMYEQELNAKIVEKKGLGIIARETPEGIKKALQELLPL